jgi:hypothetical protein
MGELRSGEAQIMSKIADRNMIREYLLGRLDEQPELEEKLSDGILLNEEMTDIVDSVEDEIIEEYLEGSLNSASRDAAEKYFLQPPQRKEKLRSAQLLKHYFEMKPSRYTAMERENFVIPPPAWVSHFRTYGAFAALALITISSLIYVSRVHRSHARLENELAQERESSSNLVKQAELLQPPIVPLTLVGDRSRGAETLIPQVQIKSSTQRIIVEIALQSAASIPYDVRLETKKGERSLWSARLLPLISSSGDARLVFDVPAGAFQSDVYSFAVSSASPASGGARHYDFQARLVK